MEPHIRIGNNIPVEWYIEKEGNAFNFEGKTVFLALKRFSTLIPIEDYQIDGNCIRFVYFAKNQREIGVGTYNLVLIVNEGEPDMVSFNCEPAFHLVSESKVNYPETITEVDDENPVVVRSKVIVPATGASAYEVAREEGFEGSVEEWLESLKGVSIVSAEQVQKTTESGGENILEITLSDGRKVQFSVFNGKQGIKGEPGESITHYWAGTTLFLRSASGWTSINLQGPQGRPGILSDLSTADRETLLEPAMAKIRALEARIEALES